MGLRSILQRLNTALPFAVCSCIDDTVSEAACLRLGFPVQAASAYCNRPGPLYKACEFMLQNLPEKPFVFRVSLGFRVSG